MQFSFSGVLIIMLCCVFIAVVIFQFRFPKTLWLIATVSPYEQVGSGAGSFLILGDSTGYGTGASAAKDSVAGRLGALYPAYSITNDSVNGRTLGELVAVAGAVNGQYDLILLQIGANDILQKRELATVRTELESALNTLADNTTHIVMISNGNVGGSVAFTGAEAAEYEVLSRQFNTMYSEVAAASPLLTYVDLFQERASDPFVQDPNSYLAWDGLHPSSIGYRYWFDVLRPVLAETLR